MGKFFTTNIEILDRETKSEPVSLYVGKKRIGEVYRKVSDKLEVKITLSSSTPTGTEADEKITMAIYERLKGLEVEEDASKSTFTVSVKNGKPLID